MKRLGIIALVFLALHSARAQTSQKMYDLRLSQAALAEIGKLSDKAPFEEVLELRTEIQSQLNAIAAAENAEAKKTADRAEADKRAKIEAEIRAQIMKAEHDSHD